MEVYAAYAMGAWLTHKDVPDEARSFARKSAIISLIFGGGGQVAYHLLAAADVERAPIVVTIIVACIPVAIVGMASALSHKLSSAPHPSASLVATPKPAPVEPATAAATTTVAVPEPTSREAKIGRAPQGAATSSTRQAPSATTSTPKNPPPAASDLPPAGPDRDAALTRRFDALKAANPNATHDDLAKETGLSRSTISRALGRHAKLPTPASEHGEPPARVLAVA
jgi:hypothetical protein